MAVQVLDPRMYPQGEYFQPNSWAQQRALLTDAPEALYSGRLGSSKSRTLTEKGDMRCRRHADSRVALCRARRVDLGLTTLRTLLDHTVSPAHRDWGWRKTADGASTLHYPNGSQIVCVGLDNPGKLRSGEFDLVLVDQCEEVTEEQWDTAQGRLRWRPYEAEEDALLEALGVDRYPYRQILGACNPADPGHFLFKRFRPDRGSHLIRSEEEQKLLSGDSVPSGTLIAECIMASATDNVENLPNDYLARLDRFKGKYHARYVLGQWLMFEGLVYDCWEPNRMVVAAPAEWERWGWYPPPDWPRYRAIDFGYVNPFVCQWWARDPMGVYWRYREVYMTHRTIGEHARVLVALEESELNELRNRLPKGEALEWLDIALSVSDHAAGDRAVLEQHDVITSAAVKDVQAGIQTVYEMMASDKLRFVRDALVERDPHLEAEELPLVTEEEVMRYRYQKRRTSVLADMDREEPFKSLDHGCDAMRYLFHTLRTLGTPEVVRL